jgi:hypothetical protein
VRALVLVLVASACGGRAAAPPPAAAAPAPAGADDPHRPLTREECAGVFAFLKEKGWLPDPDAAPEVVVGSCVEMKATRAYGDCILRSAARDEAERCQ